MELAPASVGVGVAGEQSVGRPGGMECGLLPDPEGPVCRRCVSAACSIRATNDNDRISPLGSNELERNFLELIQFNINVPSSVYAHYYFDLLQLGRNNGLYNQPSTRHSLLWDRALRLEAVNCPSGPMDDYSPKWWTKQRPLSRFLSWESINAVPSVRRVILS